MQWRVMLYDRLAYGRIIMRVLWSVAFAAMVATSPAFAVGEKDLAGDTATAGDVLTNGMGRHLQRYSPLDKINKSIIKLGLKISAKSFDVVKKKQKKTPDKPYYAWAMYLHAGVIKASGNRKGAFKLLDEAIAADPNNDDYKKAKEWWLKGN